MQLVQSEQPEKQEAQPRRLTDTDIVTGLRSEDTERRRLALEAIFPTTSAVLVHSHPQGTAVTATSKLDAPRVFTGLLFASQRLGHLLHLDLQWIPKVEDPNKIQVASSIPT